MSLLAPTAPTDDAADRFAGFLNEIDGVPVSLDAATVKRKSRDFFWYSPVLNELLGRSFGEAVVTPRDETDVLRVAAAAARYGVPITPRGGGTGNYGQAVPLEGGVVLDMIAMNRVLSTKPGVLRVQPGAKLIDIDATIRDSGYELRMHPSTKRSATIGGFVAGGSGGVGSVTYGGLREHGNILSARIVTVEPSPRVIDLKADAAQKINRAYGTTGIITELEMPLAPAYNWIDILVAFADFDQAVAFGHELALADGIVKKLVTPIAWPLPSYFGPMRPNCPQGKSLVVCMIAAPWLACFRDLLARRGAIVYQAPSEEGPGRIPLYEYTWNHTTLQVLKADRSVTYLQILFQPDNLREQIAEMTARFGDEQMMHLEFIRFGGRITASGLPVIRYKTEERLNEIIATYEACGVMVANPHVVTLEDGSRYKRADANQLDFKREVDPRGLLNPGKMRSFVAEQRLSA